MFNLLTGEDFLAPPGMSSADKKIAKMLGDVQKTPEWETC
jgi:putative tricarboxylic transport membrane protein